MFSDDLAYSDQILFCFHLGPAFRLLSQLAFPSHSFQIYDGKDNSAHVLGAFTGSAMLGLTLISTSNHLWLEFFSDADATGEGFKLVYSSKTFTFTLPTYST